MTSIKKKILLLSSGDTFGAYEYVYRMAKALSHKYDVALVVKDKRKVDNWVFRLVVTPYRKPFLKRVLSFVKRKFEIKTEIFEPDPKYVFLPNEDERISFIEAESILKVIPFVPDIVISGMTDGFLNTSTLFDLYTLSGAKVYQVMVDMSLLTGGCHVSWDCEGFKADCTDCPAIANIKFVDFAAKNFAIKHSNIQNGNYKLMVIPGWTLNQANLSALYKNRIILNSCNIVDINIFTNTNRNIAKQLFGISECQKVIFAGSNNSKDIRKGRAYLVDALSIMWNKLEPVQKEKICVMLAGNHNTQDELTLKIKFDLKLIDFISDDRLLSLAYQASDVYVCSSLEDGGPMMVAEALACGTPVVGFETGSLYDSSLVLNGIHGYRVKMKDTNELSLTLLNVIQLNEVDFKTMSLNARNQAVQYSSEKAFLNSVEKTFIN